jgi:hypothetical protein
MMIAEAIGAVAPMRVVMAVGQGRADAADCECSVMR